MGDVVTKFIEPLRRVFSVPKSAENSEAVFFSAYVNSLKTFDDRALERAAERIIDTREMRTFPLPAECNKACRDAIHALAAERETGRKVDNRWEIRNAPLEVREPTCNPKRRKRTDEMFAEFPPAREAVKDGWAWTLWDWMNEHQRCPDQYEIQKIRDAGLERSCEIIEMLGINKELKPEEKGNPFQKRLLLFWNKAQERLSNLVDGELQ